ncbi:hypothetical protein B2J93_2580 [Marssonina coronariae]|uniref:Uncharacterized protein n=1 Tax=Diplocarpon coronariae TaxID=2795749 RepID=A0A218YYM3_9HELO|nr:hypothetical protein B2J93_2580 [Marssonina coronariae]
MSARRQAIYCHPQYIFGRPTSSAQPEPLLVQQLEGAIQTKYTPPSGQDLHNMPYDPSSPLPEQIISSLSYSHQPDIRHHEPRTNRFYPGTAYEVELRQFCRGEGIVFRSFWTLSGNPALLQSAVVSQVASALEGKVESGEEEALGLYGLLVALGGVSVLHRTTNLARLRGDPKGLEVLRDLVEG